jgi:hypothetical protein
MFKAKNYLLHGQGYSADARNKNIPHKLIVRVVKVLYLLMRSDIFNKI